MKLTKCVSLSLFLILGGSLSAQDRLPTKQLAGPIDEIRTGVMAPVDPIEAGIQSKSAMIPIDLTQSETGALSWNGTVAIDNDQFNMVLFSGDESWAVRVGDDHSKTMTPAHQLAARVERSSLDVGNHSFEGDYYHFEGVQPGEWKIAVGADASLGGKGYLLLSTDSAYRLLSYKTTHDLLVGREIGFLTYGFEKVGEDVRVPANAGIVEEALLRVTTPEGKTMTRAMLDDGMHGDGIAGDGIFGGSFSATQVGEYQAQMIARGTTPEGHPFMRTAEHVVPVIAPQVELALDFAAARIIDNQRLGVSLAVHNSESAPQKYRIFAEVWGADSHGEMQPVNWIGGMSYVEDGQLNLGLDLRWIGRSTARSDFELRDVRIEDPDTFIPVIRVDRMDVATPSLPSLDRLVAKNIDQEMLLGPRPAGPPNKSGSQLLLVHGYCSSNVWSSETNHFTNESIFLDLDQNRSHDTFAVMVGTFGSSFSSFGIVAHSQGGAAALHLYTYYWSGLDYASGGRLIQSVGTPYQGTALAGNAAVLGQIFGIGCGTNYDLTYSGAASWLSGIPTWARNEVNYYTTSFKDYWWSYDYCHLVTDLLLNDPDDGTTEKSKGQLSSGVNRGHKTKWCHTSGMADPPQTTDGNRNNSMNSNAAN